MTVELGIPLIEAIDALCPAEASAWREAPPADKYKALAAMEEALRVELLARHRLNGLPLREHYRAEIDKDFLRYFCRVYFLDEEAFVGNMRGVGFRAVRVVLDGFDRFFPSCETIGGLNAPPKANGKGGGAAIASPASSVVRSDDTTAAATEERHDGTGQEIEDLIRLIEAYARAADIGERSEPDSCRRELAAAGFALDGENRVADWRFNVKIGGRRDAGNTPALSTLVLMAATARDAILTQKAGSFGRARAFIDTQYPKLTPGLPDDSYGQKVCRRIAREARGLSPNVADALRSRLRQLGPPLGPKKPS